LLPTVVAGDFVCGVINVSILFSPRANQRHAQLAAPGRQRSLCDFPRQTHRQYAVPADDRAADAAVLRHLLQHSPVVQTPRPDPGVVVGSLGISIAGTAISAISAQARMRELLLPLLLLPLLTPVLVVSSLVTGSLLDRDPIVPVEGHRVPAVFDLIFLTRYGFSANIFWRSNPQWVNASFSAR